MYLPETFKETDLRALQDVIDRYSFGLLVTAEHGEASADHLPFLLRREQGRYGTLVSHVARPNPLADALRRAHPCLVIFRGPHGYISPTWYTRDDTVPTWNYVAVHVRGTPQIIDNESDLRRDLEEITRKHEYPEDGWTLRKVEHRPELLQRILGFHVAITSIQGKFKLGQNKSKEDVASVLKRSNGERAIDPILANYMKIALERRG